MKKFFKSLLTCFIILVLFAGAVFFIGWTQIRVSPNKIGVLKSKTSGVLKEPVYSGKFSWHWQFLLPTNVDFQTYELKPYSVPVKVSGVLPSGDVYSSYTDDKIDFNYNFDFNFNATVKPEAIVALAADFYISDQDSLERYVKEACDSAAKMIASEIVKKAEKDVSYYPETLSNDEILALVDLKKVSPNVEFNNVNLISVTFPDFALYNKAREVYLKQLPDVTASKNVKPAAPQEEQASEFLGRLKQLLENENN